MLKVNFTKQKECDKCIINISSFKLVFIICCFFTLTAYSQNSINVAGGEASGLNGNASYSAGQVTYHTYSNITASISEGILQIFDTSLVTDVFNNEINITAEVHPNPADNLLILKIDNSEEDDLNFIIFDIQGTLVKKESIYQRLTLIDLSEFAPNVYFLKINNNKKNELKVFKIIKK